MATPTEALLHEDVTHIHILSTDALDRYESGDFTDEPGTKRVRTIKESLPANVEDLMLDWSAREVALSTLDIVNLAAWRPGWERGMNNLAWMLWYAEWCTARHSYFRKRKPVDDVDALVELWRVALIAMSTAHSHAGFTGAEHSSDQLLKPLMSAPIAQMREFASKLATVLEADPAVPFLVWSSYKTVVMPLILKRPEGKVAELKTELARQTAELVADSVSREDWVSSIAGALAWRSVEQVAGTREALKAGATAKVTGRQSCLFLTTHNKAGTELSRVIL